MQRMTAGALMASVLFLAGCGGSGSLAPQPAGHTAAQSAARHYRTIAEGVAAGVIKPVCPPVGTGRARCTSYVVLPPGRAPQSAQRGVSSTNQPLPEGYGPADLQSAYGLTAAARSKGAGVTVAIVDPFDTPQAEHDLAVYRARYGLPPCTTANHCFRKVNQKGRAAPLPPVAPSAPLDLTGWQVETMLDLDVVSANCPKCHILLVETDDDFMNNLGAGVSAAATFQPAAISNSYISQESPSDPGPGKDQLLPFYVHSNIAVVAGNGDSGYMTNVNAWDGSQYIAWGPVIPAAFPSVVAVGGTELVPDSSVARGWSETVWAGSGSGCSAYEPAAPWQRTDPNCMGTYTDANGHTGTFPSRVYGDVAYAANNVAFYDSVPAGGWSGGWMVSDGTSISSPGIAAIYGLSGYGPNGNRSGDDGDFPAQKLYASRRSLFDVTTGSNWDFSGACAAAYLCYAGSGYDAPTGNGSPNGLAAF